MLFTNDTNKINDESGQRHTSKVLPRNWTGYTIKPIFSTKITLNFDLSKLFGVIDWLECVVQRLIWVWIWWHIRLTPIDCLLLSLPPQGDRDDILIRWWNDIWIFLVLGQKGGVALIHHWRGTKWFRGTGLTRKMKRKFARQYWFMWLGRRCVFFLPRSFPFSCFLASFHFFLCQCALLPFCLCSYATEDK